MKKKRIPARRKGPECHEAVERTLRRTQGMGLQCRRRAEGVLRRMAPTCGPPSSTYLLSATIHRGMA